MSLAAAVAAFAFASAEFAVVLIVVPSRPSTLSALRLTTLPLPLTFSGAVADDFVFSCSAAPDLVFWIVVVLLALFVLPRSRLLPVAAYATAFTPTTRTAVAPMTASTRVVRGPMGPPVSGAVGRPGFQEPPRKMAVDRGPPAYPARSAYLPPVG